MSMPFQFCKGCCQWLVDRSLLEENYALQAYPYIKKEIRDEFDYKKADELSNVKEVLQQKILKKFMKHGRSGCMESIHQYFFFCLIQDLGRRNLLL